MNVFNQFRSVIQWDTPNDQDLFIKFTSKGEEIKNASTLTLLDGQACILTYEGQIEGILEEAGTYDLKSENKPFITSIKKFLQFKEGSEHLMGIWFFRKADILNMRWGTRVPIAYKDPIYKFPILLTAFGNYSIRITKPKYFFTNILAGQEVYCKSDLKEIFISRVVQPITDYLANAKFSFQEIDANLESIAAIARERTAPIFEDLGFEIIDFRIEGSQFDRETLNRINEISDVQAEVNAAEIAGVNFAELQKLKALRDAAKNESAAGMAMGMMSGLNLANDTHTPSIQNNALSKDQLKSKLKDLKELFDEDLITEEEYQDKRKALMEKF